MHHIKYLIFFIIFFSLQISSSLAEKIVYIDIEKIMKESKAGKSIIEKINKTNEKNIKEFKKIEENLKKRGERYNRKKECS